jgi:hypothetical protein
VLAAATIDNRLSIANFWIEFNTFHDCHHITAVGFAQPLSFPFSHLPVLSLHQRNLPLINPAAGTSAAGGLELAQNFNPGTKNKC